MLHPFGGAHHIRQPDAEFLIDHHHLTARDAHAVHQHVEGFSGEAIELDDRAGRELQQIAHRHARASNLERQRDRNVEDQIQVHFLAAGAGGIGT